MKPHDAKALRTLRDAGLFLSDGPHFQGVRHNPALEHACRLLIQAAESGNAADIIAATDQLERLLRSRRLL